MAKAAAAPDKEYILDLIDGNTRRITVPSTWKLTFGNLIPYIQKNDPNHASFRSSNPDMRIALRFYEGTKENLRMVMTDVRSFRDASVKVMEKRTSVKRQAAQKQTSQGMKDVVVEARITEWVDPDADEKDAAVPDEFLSLPKD